MKRQRFLGMIDMPIMKSETDFVNLSVLNRKRKSIWSLEMSEEWVNKIKFKIFRRACERRKERSFIWESAMWIPHSNIIPYITKVAGAIVSIAANLLPNLMKESLSSQILISNGTQPQRIPSSIGKNNSLYVHRMWQNKNVGLFWIFSQKSKNS